MVSFIVALITSVLSGLGIGGGGLLVIYLAFFTDTPQITAQGINLLFFIFSSIIFTSWEYYNTFVYKLVDFF